MTHIARFALIVALLIVPACVVIMVADIRFVQQRPSAIRQGDFASYEVNGPPGMYECSTATGCRLVSR